MRTTVKKWGNSAAVRIPLAILQAARLAMDDPVEIREEKGRIVIEPLRRVYDLDELVNRITPGNRHGEVDLWPPAGREASCAPAGVTPKSKRNSAR